ncbi:MipA/OmpV family protein, partial [Pantoea allii]
MNQFKLKTLVALLPCYLLTSQAIAAPLSLGASVIYAESPYRGGQDRYIPLPVINYEG